METTLAYWLEAGYLPSGGTALLYLALAAWLALNLKTP
jgi:hypothetical protein